MRQYDPATYDTLSVSFASDSVVAEYSVTNTESQKPLVSTVVSAYSPPCSRMSSSAAVSDATCSTTTSSTRMISSVPVCSNDIECQPTVRLKCVVTHGDACAYVDVTTHVLIPSAFLTGSDVLPAPIDSHASNDGLIQ